MWRAQLPTGRHIGPRRLHSPKMSNSDLGAAEKPHLHRQALSAEVLQRALSVRAERVERTVEPFGGGSNLGIWFFSAGLMDAQVATPATN